MKSSSLTVCLYVDSGHAARQFEICGEILLIPAWDAEMGFLNNQLKVKLHSLSRTKMYVTYGIRLILNQNVYDDFIIFNINANFFQRYGFKWCW